MVLCVDIDNTINNLQESVIKQFNKKHKTKYVLDDFQDYNVENVLPVKEAVAMKDMYIKHGVYDNVKPLAGSQDVLQKLISEGHQVYLVTDSHPAIFEEKVQWVKHFFPFIGSEHIVAMKHKNLFRCDLMIEDNIQNILSGVHYHRVCLDYAWNQKVHDEAYGIHRCTNWHEILDVVNKLNEEE